MRLVMVTMAREVEPVGRCSATLHWFSCSLLTGFLISPGLAGCGLTSRNADTNGGATGGTAAGGAPSTGGSGVGGVGAASSMGGASAGGTATGGTATGGTGTGGTATGGTATGGASGNGGIGGSSTSTPPTADLTGVWGMYAFEDPVAIDVQQSGHTLSGRGCCAPPLNDPLSFCCGPLHGAIEGNWVRFSFVAGGAPYIYSFDGYVSEDETRMGGRFNPSGTPSDTDLKVAWQRADAETWLPRGEDLPLEDLERSSQPQGFQLSESSTAGDGFVEGELYTLRVYAGLAFYGDFGAFWNNEVNVDLENQRITLGPVSQTASDLPLSVNIDLEDNLRMTGATVIMPSGMSYLFDPVY